MNLLMDTEPVRWIPVRCRSGQRRLISPFGLFDTDDPPMELDAMRPDFNGALAQFLIGLLQWLAPADAEEWCEIAQGNALPDFERLRELAHCFEFDTGPRRFMQDMDFAPTDGGDLSGLLLEAPGGNTVKNNADLFVKRSESMALSLPLAAQALLTLQVNAPSGGQGHRTSLRGGGPVSMLLWPAQMAGQAVPLWRKLWLNTLVLEGDAPREEIIFPWMADCLTSEKAQDVRTLLAPKAPTPIELAILAYFATPRRIRLQFEDECQCSLTGQSGRCATGFETQNFGANYRSEMFQHPLSPYYRDKKSGFLPVHIGPLGFTFADWLTSQNDGEDYRKPMVLDSARLDAALKRALPADAIWAFGFTMDNMKCLGWHEVHFPLLAIEDKVRLTDVLIEARRWIDATEQVRQALGRQLRAAWTGSGKKGDTSAAERALYALTKPAFYVLVNEYAALEDAGDAARDAQRQALRGRWQRQLAQAALKLFERHAERGDVAEQNIQTIRRAALAHRALGKVVHVDVKKTLELGVAEQVAKKAASQRRKAA